MITLIMLLANSILLSLISILGLMFGGLNLTPIIMYGFGIIIGMPFIGIYTVIKELGKDAITLILVATLAYVLVFIFCILIGLSPLLSFFVTFVPTLLMFILTEL